MIGLVLGVFENGEPFTTAHVDFFLSRYRDEARAIRRRLRGRVVTETTQNETFALMRALEEVESRIEFWISWRRAA